MTHPLAQELDEGARRCVALKNFDTDAGCQPHRKVSEVRRQHDEVLRGQCIFRVSETGNDEVLCKSNALGVGGTGNAARRARVRGRRYLTTLRRPELGGVRASLTASDTCTSPAAR